MKHIFAFVLIFASLFASAQPDDMQRMADSLDALNKPAHEFTSATFKGTSLINFPTVETVGIHGLDFRIAHRFGEFYNKNSGTSAAYNAFGLDGGACIRLSFDYGITKWLQVGIGRTSQDKLADGSVKIRALRQTTDNKMPVSLTIQTGLNYTFMHDPNKSSTGIDKYHYPVDRMSYGTAIVLGRKFSERFSIEFNGFYVHYNIVDHATDKNDIFAAGISGRYKVTKRMAITFEYAYTSPDFYSPIGSTNYGKYHNPFGIGIDMETGGHVFQLHFTNQFGMNEAQYIPYTSSDFFKGGIRLGFNISRVFAIGHHDPNSW
ncbi:DUF5777 family beta-barrel protein [soil metagenome]